MTRTWLPLCLLLTLLASAASADPRTIPMGSEQSTLTLTEQRDDILVYRAQVGDLQAMDVTSRDGTFTRIMIPGFHRTFRIRPRLLLPFLFLLRHCSGKQQHHHR